MSRVICAILISLALLMLLPGCHLRQGGAPVSEPEVGEPPAAVIGDTPEFTPTTTLTATITLTSTSEKPMVSVTTETFCRSGPGEPYDILGTLKVGQSAEVIGRNAYGDTWVIILPTTPPITCWMWDGYATLTGNGEGVPVISPPPTPTPQANFTFAYEHLGFALGFQCVDFTIHNTGGTTWQSFSLTINNTTQGVSGSRTSNIFTGYSNSCLQNETQGDLAPGESGTATANLHMPLAPAGNHVEATLILCTGVDGTGTCLTKSINFIF